MRIVFMGTPEFAAVSLQSLMDAKHEILGVVTQPDKPKGRKKAVTFLPVKALAIKENIPCYQPTKVNDESFIDIVRELNPDVIVVAAFGQILSKSILELPKYGCINVHASLLPKYRGAAPISWVVINGEKEAGVTIMHMDVGCDTGDMIIKDQILLEEKETGGSLHDKLAKLGGQLIVKALPMIEDGTAPRIVQEESESTYVKMLKKEDGRIDFDKSASSIECFIRGMNPWPSAFTSLNDKMLKIWDADVCSTNLQGENGEIVEVTKDSLIVKTQQGALAIKELQLEGKKRMLIEDFLRGYPVTVGTKLV